MKLTEKEMIMILRNNRINKYSKKERDQIMDFAFGEDFMKSKDKGKLKKYS